MYAWLVYPPRGSIFCTACAPSEITKFTGWAQPGLSPRKSPNSATGRKGRATPCV